MYHRHMFFTQDKFVAILAIESLTATHKLGIKYVHHVVCDPKLRI